MFFWPAIIGHINQRWGVVVFYLQQDLTNAICAQYTTQTSTQIAQVCLLYQSLCFNSVWQRIDGWLSPCLLILISIGAYLLGTNRIPSTIQYTVAAMGPGARHTFHLPQRELRALLLEAAQELIKSAKCWYKYKTSCLCNVLKYRIVIIERAQREKGNSFLQQKEE